MVCKTSICIQSTRICAQHLRNACLLHRSTDRTNWSSSGMLKIFKSRPAAARKCGASAAGFVRREDGAAALEFAMVGGTFIAVVLATIQTAGAFFAGQVLESAAIDASRMILTGSAQKANMDQT